MNEKRPRLTRGLNNLVKDLKSKENRVLVIGDIHGCSQALADLLKIMEPIHADDTIVFIGDYIDRGPDSKGVIDIILNLTQEWVEIYFRSVFRHMRLPQSLLIPLLLAEIEYSVLRG